MGVRFTEEMTGWCTFGATDHRAGVEEGRRSATSLMFHLTISVEDLAAFRADPDHEAGAVGWVACPALDENRMLVTRGRFNLFAPGSGPDRTTMRYRLHLLDSDGRAFTLVGTKDVGDDPGFDLWRDTTSLATTLFEGHVAHGDDEGAVARARGYLFIPPLDFARQLTTFRGSPRDLVGFGALFMGALVRTYRGRARRAG